jgi:Uma2 family endonuclease
MSNEHETDPTKGVPMTSATAEAPALGASAVLSALLYHEGAWTVSDLEALGLDDKIKVEIDDGSLLVSPAPAYDHQRVIFLFGPALEESLGNRYHVVGEVNLYVHESDYYRPDLIVTRSGSKPPRRRVWWRPEDVALAIEVESPGTAAYDRVNKFRSYARAGVPAYWRLEMSPCLTVVEHRLSAGGTYDVVATHSSEMKTDFPGPVSIDLDRLNSLIVKEQDE